MGGGSRRGVDDVSQKLFMLFKMIFKMFLEEL